MSRGYWKKFLIDAGIPVRAAESYTSSFVENRITESMVPDLNKSVLIDLGITIIGDVIAILKHAILITEEASVEKRNSRKQSRSDRRRSSSERGEKKSKKPEPEKKSEPAPAKKSVEKAAVKTKENKTVIKVGHNTEKKRSHPQPKTAPRKVTITDQAVIKESTTEQPKPVPQRQFQEVKRVKVKKEVPAVRTVSTKPAEVKTKRTTISNTTQAKPNQRPVSATTPKPKPTQPTKPTQPAASLPDKPSITQLVKKVAPHVKHVTLSAPTSAPVRHVTSSNKSVTSPVRSLKLTNRKMKHVSIREDEGRSSRQAAVQIERRQPVATESEESDSYSEEEEEEGNSPVTRRVFGSKQSRDTEVITREVTEAASRDEDRHVTSLNRHVTSSTRSVTSSTRSVTSANRKMTHVSIRDAESRDEDEMSRDSESDSPSVPVIVRRAAVGSHSPPPQNKEPVITRLLPDEPCTITRSVSGVRSVSGNTRTVSGTGVKRTVQNAQAVQTVRCVSPDSTTDTPPPKPKQTTTIILNTKGKCSVRPVSPPLDMMVERKRKVMPRNDGKTTLTRVVQRHLDSSSPHHSPKRNKITAPTRNSDHKQIGAINSEKYNSFRSDAEESELRQNNKFRSEDDAFDVVPEKMTQIRRKVRSRSYSGGRSNTSLSKRLGSVRGSDLRKSLPTRVGGVAAKSLPARVGGVAARVFGESRMSRSGRNSASQRLNSARQASRSFGSRTTERSVFSRLGD